MVTTARDPSVKLKIFAKEMKLILPNSKRINRGNLEINGLIAECRKNNFTDLIILTENRGKPDGMRGKKLNALTSRAEFGGYAPDLDSDTSSCPNSCPCPPNSGHGIIIYF